MHREPAICFTGGHSVAVWFGGGLVVRARSSAVDDHASDVSNGPASDHSLVSSSNRNTPRPGRPTVAPPQAFV